MEWLKEVEISGVLDILFMSFLIYAILVWFKKTAAAFVLTGILIIAGVYLLTLQFHMTLTAAVFERFFAVILIALVVIFQEELRHFFERIAVWSLNRRLVRREVLLPSREEIEVLVRALSDFARERIGALVVVKGRDMLLRHLDGGWELDGKLSEALLKSIFDPHSIGHDGAVILEGKKITRFAAHLPLSKNAKKIGLGGTRHAAALGLSELSDALCLVVSEEKGTISMMRQGELRHLGGAEELTVALEDFYREIRPEDKARKIWGEIFKKNSREKLIAILLALGLWFELVYGSKIIYKTFITPISYAQLSRPWAITELQPKEIELTFQGPRRAFYFLSKQNVRLWIYPKKTEGWQEIKFGPGDVSYPKNIHLEEIQPKAVKLKVEVNKETVPE